MPEDFVNLACTLLVADTLWDDTHTTELVRLLKGGCPADTVIQFRGGIVRSLLYYAAKRGLREAMGTCRTL